MRERKRSRCSLLTLVVRGQGEVAELLWERLEKIKAGASKDGENPVLAHLFECGWLFTRPWTTLEFLYRGTHGTGKVWSVLCCVTQPVSASCKMI